MPATQAAARVRLATLDDAEEVAELYRQEGKDGAGDWLEQGGAVILEDSAGHLISALCWREEADGWRLAHPVIVPEYCGQGFGRWLVTKLEAVAIKENVPALYLFIEPERADLLAYYGRMGYRQNGEMIDKILLKKSLGGTWQFQER